MLYDSLFKTKYKKKSKNKKKMFKPFIFLLKAFLVYDGRKNK